MSAVRLILASASPARLETLRRAGIEPLVEVSRVDESTVEESEPARLALTLARLKADDVASRLGNGHRRPSTGDRTLVLGCDSVLDLDGVAYGKPDSPETASMRLRQLRGRSGVLHTGHALLDLANGERRLATAATTVVFAMMTSDEIAAYVATGEPLAVAGSFTIDGIGGAFVERIEGDPHNVVGLSLPLVRAMVTDLGVAWPALWNRPARSGPEPTRPPR